MAGRRLSDGSQGEKINPQILKLASNILTVRDARTKQNYWSSEVIFYNDWMEKKGWNRNLTLIPHLDDYNKIKEEIKSELEGAETSPCFVLGSDNNYLTFALTPKSFKTGNPFIVDMLRPDIVLFFKGGKNNTWKDNAVMYRIVSTKYIDTRKASLEITAKKDYCWIYHENVMSVPAVVRVSKSQLARYYKDGEVWREYPDVCFSVCGDLRRSKFLAPVEKGSGTLGSNPGTPVVAEWQPRYKLYLHNIDTEVSSQEGSSKHIEWKSLMTPEGCHADGCNARRGTCDSSECPKMPALILLKKAGRNDFEKTLNSKVDVHFFMFPYEVEDNEHGYLKVCYYYDGKLGRDKQATQANYSNAFQAWLPENFNEQPHLIASEHSSVQFYFMRKLINSAPMNQYKITYEENGQLELSGGLNVKGKKKGELYGETKHVLLYKVAIKASLAGICYHFESGSQWFRVEISAKGFVAGKDYFMTKLRKMKKDIDEWIDRVFDDGDAEPGDDKSGWGIFGVLSKIWGAIRFFASGLVAATPGWIAGYVNNMKTNPKDLLKDQGLELKKEKAGDVPLTQTGTDAKSTGGNNNVSSGGDVMLKSGETVSKEYYEEKKQAAEKEATTNKAVKATWEGLGKTVVRATSFANTINIDYDFGEFFNRSQAEPLEIRFELSDQLHDALTNNNNLPVAQTIDNRIKCLNNLVDPDLGAQEVQAEIVSFFDGSIGEEYKRAFAQGITFYSLDTFDDDFPTLALKHANTKSVAMDLASSDPGAEGGQIDIIKKGKKKGKRKIGEGSRTKANEFWQRGHFLIEYVDGSRDHWGVKMPMSGSNAKEGLYSKTLVRGHKTPSFNLKFSKPVKQFYDVYSCIGCGASGQGFEACGMSNYDNSTGDSWSLLKNLKVDFWWEDLAFSSGVKTRSGKTLGATIDVWPSSLQNAGEPMKEAHGYVKPGGGSIIWEYFTYDEGGGEDEVKIGTSVKPTPVPRADDTLPDGSTVGGRPSPTGGMPLAESIQDVNEMGFTADDSLGGQAFGMNMDMNMAEDLTHQEVSQLTQDVMETMTDDLENYQEESQQEQNTTVDENVDTTENKENTQQQNENSDTLGS